MKTSVRSFAVRPTLKSSFHVVAFLLCSVTILNFVGSGQLSFFVTDSSEGQICRVEVVAVVCELNRPSVRKKMKQRERERLTRPERWEGEEERMKARKVSPCLDFFRWDVRAKLRKSQFTRQLSKDSTLLFVPKSSRLSPFILPETNQERRGNRCQSTSWRAPSYCPNINQIAISFQSRQSVHPHSALWREDFLINLFAFSLRKSSRHLLQNGLSAEKNLGFYWSENKTGIIWKTISEKRRNKVHCESKRWILISTDEQRPRRSRRWRWER